MPRRRRAAKNVRLRVQPPGGGEIIVDLLETTPLRERLRCYVELADYEFVYARGQVQRRDTPRNMRLPLAGALIQAMLERDLPKQAAMIGHLRSEGFDASKFEISASGNIAHAVC
jgi:hypothetical protein